MIQGHRRRVVEVTPTLDTSEYAAGDILFNRQEIPGAVMGLGECSKLLNVTMTSKKASFTETEIAIFQNDQSLDAANDPFDISAADGAAAGFLGWIELASGGGLDCGDFVVAMPTRAAAKPLMPMLLQAAAGSTSVYFVAINRATVTYAASDLTFKFHIEY